jgi:hypothetical protein
VAGLKGDYCLQKSWRMKQKKNSKSGGKLLPKNETAKPTLHPISSTACKFGSLRFVQRFLR